MCVCVCVCVVRQGRGSGVHKMFGWDPISGVPSRMVVGWLLVTTTQQQLTHTHTHTPTAMQEDMSEEPVASERKGGQAWGDWMVAWGR